VSKLTTDVVTYRYCTEASNQKSKYAYSVPENILLQKSTGKSYMSFRFVPKSVTLNDLERRNSPNGTVISQNSAAFGADYVKVVEDTPILSAAEM